MKRHGLAILINPYKNVLLSRDHLRQALDDFFGRFLEIVSRHQNLRLNLVVPGYMLQCTDPILLAQVRELAKRGDLEWLFPGYTEPFLSFSPEWLSSENIKEGARVFEELAGSRPGGFVPAFSNWEPSHAAMLRDCGIQYVVVSQALLPREARDSCGYWISEHGGISMVLQPAHVLHHYTAPASLPDWLDRTVERDAGDQAARQVAIEYLVPLVPEDGIDPYRWLGSLAESLETVLLKFQISLLGEFASSAPPLGLQYLPSNLAFRREEDEAVPGFQNYLHTYDQVGILQRKMMTLAQEMQALGEGREQEALRRELFMAQDINRYLPNKRGGFGDLADRLWCYGRMIDIDAQLMKRERLKGGQIRITDFLRNGTKCIVLSNNSLKAFIDHKNGGQVFELDFRARSANLFAAFNPRRHSVPRIAMPGKSYTSFVDHLLDTECQAIDFAGGAFVERGDFVGGQFDYSVKKSAEGAKAVLRRQGSVAIDDRQYPLTIEKVFGLKGDTSEFSFAYQLANQCLTQYAFRFAVELCFALPGVVIDQAYVGCGRSKHRRLLHNRVFLDDVTEWGLHDPALGVSLLFVTQKPVSVWCYSARRGNPTGSGYEGTSLVISASVSLEENAMWSLVGRMSCRKARQSSGCVDAV